MNFRAPLRAIAIISATLLCCCGYFAALIFNGLRRRQTNALEWSQRWAYLCRRILGISLSVEGNLPTGQAFLAPNHIGYCDIIALGSLCPCAFAAKDDAAQWPVIGSLLKLGGHMTVPRKATRALKNSISEIADRLGNGQTVCVFLEGTSTAGETVLPFHSTFLRAAISANAPVHPVSIQWRCEEPDVNIAEDVAYWKDHDFLPHLWRFLGTRQLSAHIQVAPPLSPTTESARSLASKVHSEVRKLHGRILQANRPSVRRGLIKDFKDSLPRGI